jgi:hypothetical protein
MIPACRPAGLSTPCLSVTPLATEG